MKSQEIERILEKYYNGETSLEEERLLKEYFSGHEIPAHLQAEKAMFTSFLNEKGKGLQDNDFDRLVEKKISDKGSIVNRFMTNRRWIYAAASIAATVLILLAVLIRFEPVPKKLQDTYNDPETAYKEAKKVLLFVSAQFNRGTDQLQPLSTYNDGISELKSFKAFDDGLNSLEKVNKYNKIEQMTKKSK